MLLLFVSANAHAEEDDEVRYDDVSLTNYKSIMLRDRVIRKLMIEEMLRLSDWKTNSFVGFEDDDEEQRRPAMRRRGERRGGVGEMMGASLGGLTSAWLGEWTSFLGGLTGGLGRPRGEYDASTASALLSETLVPIPPGETCLCNRRCYCAAQCKRFVGAKKRACVLKCMAVGVCPG